MDQLNLFEEPKDHSKPVQIENGEYIYIPDFYSGNKADAYLNALLSLCLWTKGRLINLMPSTKSL